jgi:hypothetical protein
VILFKRLLTTFKSVDKFEGDLVVNAHQASYGGFVEAEGSEVEDSFGAASDRAITIEGRDALEGDLLGHAVYGEIPGNLHPGLASEGDHLWQAVNFRWNKLSGWELVRLKNTIADVAVTLILVALEVAQVGGELGGADRDSAIGRYHEVAGDGRGGALGVIGEVNADELLCDDVSCRRPIRVKGSVDARSWRRRWRLVAGGRALREELGCDGEYHRKEQEATCQGSRASIGRMQCHVTFSMVQSCDRCGDWLVGRDNSSKGCRIRLTATFWPVQATGMRSLPFPGLALPQRVGQGRSGVLTSSGTVVLAGGERSEPVPQAAIDGQRKGVLVAQVLDPGRRMVAGLRRAPHTAG